MKLGTALIISLLAILALVAELILYFVLGFGAALAGGSQAVSGFAFLFVGLMIVTGALGVLSPICAVVELLTKKPNLGYFLLLPALALVGIGYVGLVLPGQVATSRVPTSSGASSSTTDAAPSPSEVAPIAALTPEQKAEEEKKRQAAATAQQEQEQQRLGLRWIYDESSDKMGRGTVKHAWVRSLNEVEFGFPYTGSQRAILQLRIHPKYGKNAIISIEKGQFLCGFDGCSVSVKFDKGKPQTYSVNKPADHSTTYLFLNNYDRFLAGVKKSTTVYIEAQFYQEASRVFEFYVSGLKW